MQRRDQRRLAGLIGCMAVLCFVDASVGQSPLSRNFAREVSEADCAEQIAPMGESPPGASPPPYKLLRAEEDYRYLRDPSQRTDIWDPVKYVPLGLSEDCYFSVGGEVRERFELYHNPVFGQAPQDSHGNNAYFLQRYMFHGDLHLGPSFRIFAQFKSGLEDGRSGGPRPFDEDRFDLNQAFLDWIWPLGDKDAVTLRLGRQDLAYGSGRLIDPREGPNVRLSFDGVRALTVMEDWKVDAFLTKPVETNPGVLDDRPDPKQTLWGVYAVHPFALLPNGNIDLYYLGSVRDLARFDEGVAKERRHTIGTRWWGVAQPWDYNWEFVYQFGSFGNGIIQAWTVASDTGYTFQSAALTPRLGLRADIASGDRNALTPNLQTFNPLYPSGNYFNQADDLIGPANFIDLHPTLGLHLSKSLIFETDCDFFWRERAQDGIYGLGVNLIRSAHGSGARFVTSELSALLQWSPTRHLSVTAAYTHAFAGSFLQQTGPGRDVDFLATWVTYKF